MDKMGTYTGAGRIDEVIVNVGQTKTIMIELWNYNIDGNLLKPEHERYLKEKLAPYMKAHSVHAKLIGKTSRSGDREYNRQLSMERVLRVKNILIKQGLPESKVPGQEMRAAGPDLATGETPEDGRDRAVSITVAVGTKSRPLPKPKPRPQWHDPVPDWAPIIPPLYDPPPADEPPEPVNTRFKIKVSNGDSMGVGEFLDVVIWDQEHGVAVIYTYSGLGPSVDLGASKTFDGNWTDLPVDTPHRVVDFAGPAMHEGAGAGPFTLFDRLQLTTLTGPRIVSLDSGFTVGAGIGTTNGMLEQATQPFEFHGP